MYFKIILILLNSIIGEFFEFYTYENKENKSKYTINISQLRLININWTNLIENLEKSNFSVYNLFNNIKDNDLLLNFFFTKKINKYYINHLSKPKSKVDFDNNIDYLHISKFFYYLKGFKEYDECYYYYPLWNNDESFEKFKIIFYNYINKNLIDKFENYDYTQDSNTFYFFIKYLMICKNNKKSYISWIYKSNEKLNYPICFNYKFLPQIKNNWPDIDELKFFKIYLNIYKHVFKKVDVVNNYLIKDNMISIHDYNKYSRIFKYFTFFSKNIINILREYIVFNKNKIDKNIIKYKLKDNKILVFNFSLRNIYMGIKKNKFNGQNFYERIYEIFNIGLKHGKKYYEFIDKNNFNNNIVYFNTIFKNKLNLEFFSLELLFHYIIEGKLNFFKECINLLNKSKISTNNINFGNNNLNIIINKILFQFNLNHKNLLIFELYHRIIPIINFFWKYSKNNNEKWINYFNYEKYKNNKLKKFKNDNIILNLKNKEIENISLILLFNVNFQIFQKSLNYKNKTLYNQLKKYFKEKIIKFKRTITDIHKILKYNKDLKESINIIINRYNSFGILISSINSIGLITYSIIINNTYNIIKNIGSALLKLNNLLDGFLIYNILVWNMKFKKKFWMI